MRSGLPKLLITGGAGFIGSACARLALKLGYRASIVDSLTYAADLRRLPPKGNFSFHKADICDKNKLSRIFRKEKPEIVLHCAAQTHVDRSIRDARLFVQANVTGTFTLIEEARRVNTRKFIHISTDEVYGEIKRGACREDAPLNPSSPYAATKAAAELLVRSYMRTYGFPACIIRPCNNYGPWQYPEKLIPLALSRVLNNEKMPVYARGENVREWLYVDDCACGIFEVIEKGREGETYNLGSSQARRNIDVINSILKTLNASGKSIAFVKDRPGHDLRYRMDSSRLLRVTGWQPKIKFEDGLLLTVHWYLKNRQWVLSKEIFKR